MPPPSGVRAKLRAHPNVATRTRRIAYELAQLGDELATLSSIAIGRPLTSNDTVGLSKATMDYEGWWLNPQAEPVSRHAPPSMTGDQFLSRCEPLDQLVIEALSERLLRKTIIKLGVDQQDILALRSLKLLVRILNLATIAAQAHLRVVKDASEILHREADVRAQGLTVVDLPILHHLHELRIMRSHKTWTSQKGEMSDALATMGVDQRSTAAGWGFALDALYDGVASELESAYSIFRRALGGQS